MEDQNNRQESFVSLSAFLSLEPTNNNTQNQPFKNVFKAQDIQINLNLQMPDGGAFQNSPDQYQNQQNQHEQKIESSRKQPKNYSKNYRKRHREYVDSLKAMNQKYQKKIEQLTLKIDQMNEQIKCLKYGRQLSDSSFDTMFFKQKEQTLKQLVNEPDQQNKLAWQKVRQFVDVYGFAGREKINLLNYYMSQIIDNLIIDHHKNFVLNGLRDFQVSQPWAKIICQKQQEICGMNEAQFKSIKKFLKKSMVESIKKFHLTGQQFYQSYVKLINQTIKIQNQFANLKQGITRMLEGGQFLKVLNWYQQNKFCKQIQLLRKQWYESFRKK